LIARAFEVFLGVFCVLSAILLYPDQEEKIQSKIEDLWVKADYFKDSVLSRHAAFVTGVARVESKLLDRLFGHKLISLQSVSVSFCCCYLTWSLSDIATIALNYWQENEWARYLSRLDLNLDIRLLVPALVGTFAIIFIRESPRLRWAVVALSFVIILAQAFEAQPHFFSSRLADRLNSTWILSTAIQLFGGFVCDAAFIVLTRQLLRLVQDMTSSIKVFGTVLLNIVFALLLVCPLFVLPAPPIGPDQLSNEVVTLVLLQGIAVTNLLDAAIAFLFVFLAAVLLIHRLLWPLLTRTLFRMQDIGTKGRRSILVAVGLALLSASVFGGKVPDLVKDLVKTLAG
ncbi:MAG: hypothetical protein ABSG16_24850, partial [Candidatus Acidiferrum sp.]